MERKDESRSQNSGVPEVNLPGLPEAVALPLNPHQLEDLRGALDAHAIVAFTDARGRITYASDRFCAISKWSREELLGRDHSVISSGYHPKEFIRNLWDTITSGQVWKGELKNRAKDGSHYWVDTTIVPFVGSDGKPVQYVAIRVDITSRKLLELRNAELIERLQAANFQLSNFIADSQSVAEQRRITARALESEEFLRAVADNIPGMVGYWDSELRCHFSNHAYQDWFGRTAEQMRGISIRELMGESLFEKNQPYIRAALHGEVQKFERKLVRPDGSIGYVAAQYVPRQKDGRTQGFYALVVDITERKQAELALAENREFLENIINSVPSSVFAFDLEHRYVLLNDAHAQFMGMPKEAILGKKVHDMFPDDIADTLLAANRRVLATGEPLFTQQRLTTRSGKAGRELMTVKFALRDANGKISGLAGVTTDITELEQATVALRQSEERLKLAVRGSTDAPWDWNLADGDIYCSPRWWAMLGYEEGELPISDRLWRDLAHPSDEFAADQSMAGALEGGLDSYQVVVRLRHKEGHYIPVLSRAFISRDAGGKPVRISGTNSDLTENHRARDSMQLLLAEKDTLLKEVHHRVKNNLMLITSLLRLEAGRSASAETKSVLGEMQGRIRSMAQLHEILYSAKDFAEVDLGAYLAKLSGQIFQSLVDRAGAVRIHLDMAPAKGTMGQAVYCGLLVNELISNGLKHAFPDGRAGDIRIRLQPLDGTSRLRLSVGDNGVGLPADFESRLEESLGMQLVSMFAEQLGGQLQVESGPPSEISVTFEPGVR